MKIDFADDWDWVGVGMGWRVDYPSIDFGMDT